MKSTNWIAINKFISLQRLIIFSNQISIFDEIYWWSLTFVNDVKDETETEINWIALNTSISLQKSLPFANLFSVYLANN